MPFIVTVKGRKNLGHIDNVAVGPFTLATTANGVRDAAIEAGLQATVLTLHRPIDAISIMNTMTED